MRVFAALFAVLAVAACDVPQSGGRQGVEIDGFVVLVEQDLRGAGQNYFAVHRPGETFRMDRSQFSRNVRAIEAISGCTVDPATITNNEVGIYTTAAVVC